MKKVIAIATMICFVLLGCESRTPIVYSVNKSEELKQYESESIQESQFEELLEQQKAIAESESIEAEKASVWTKKIPDRKPVRVKGVYVSAKVAGSSAMQKIIDGIDATEVNAVVIDILDDKGRVECAMSGDVISAIGSAEETIPDIHALMSMLKEHNIYTIARIVTFRDPYLANIRPEWMNHNADGTVFYDNSGMAWVDPYNREAWEYKIQVAEQCADVGFDEIQFDYVRFCTEKGMNNVVYSEEETQGMDKTEIISEFVKYASERLAAKNVFMSADVFGTIIGSYVDTISVGQDYSAMAGAVDYMCPMIYPSHYGNGNFGLDVPDIHPYEAILGACNASKKDLALENCEGVHQAHVRPWLQGFTASYLSSYIHYGPAEIRQEIQAVYDAGYDEWLIWNASNDYQWEAFLSDEAAEREDAEIAARREAVIQAAAAEREAEMESIEASKAVESASQADESVSENAASTE